MAAEKGHKTVGVYDRPARADRPRGRWVLIAVILIALFIGLFALLGFF